MSKLSIFCDITDSSVLCITWIYLQNCRGSLGKVQDAVDQRGCRHILGVIKCFLQRWSESHWGLSADDLNMWFDISSVQDDARRQCSYLHGGVGAVSWWQRWWFLFVCVRRKTGEIRQIICLKEQYVRHLVQQIKKKITIIMFFFCFSWIMYVKDIYILCCRAI